MQNRTGLAGPGFAGRLLQQIKAHMHAVKMAAAGAGGYVLASCYLFGGAAPFGVAFCAALGPPYAFCAGLGAVLGYTFSASPLVNMKYLAAVALVMALKWLFARTIRATGAWSAAVVLAAMGIAGAATLIASDATLYDVLLATAEVCIGAGSAYFFTRTLQIRTPERASRAELSCGVVSFAILVMGLSAVHLGPLALGRIIAAAVVLLCARAGGEAGGAVSGVTAGMTMGLCGGDYAYAVAAYSFGGLLSGVFGGLGRVATAGVFVIINAVIALFTKTGTDVYTALLEVFIASLLFAAVPDRVIARLRTIRRDNSTEGDSASQDALQGRITNVAQALRDIGQTTREVGERLGKMESGGSLEGVYSRVADRVCGHCGMKTACWQFRYTDTMNAINDAMLILRKDGAVSRGQMAKHFTDTCVKLDEFVSELNTQFYAHVAREGVQRKVAKVRGVMTDQFEGLAMLLEEVSEEMAGVRLLEADVQRRVWEYFKKTGLHVDKVCCYANTYDRISVEAYFPEEFLSRFDGANTALDLSALLEVEFDLPYTDRQGGRVAAAFTEKATFTTEVGVHQVLPEGNRLCGDACEYIPNHAGRAEFILSDGMGSGGGAAVDSHMAATLLARLLAVGFGHESALKMVNSALLIKSGEESLATVDICSLDLYTGRAEFYKAGAAPTFIVRDGRAGFVESTSLPAGILQGVAFDKSGLTLKEGDVIVMVSDGVVATGSEWVKSELPLLAGGDMQRLAEKLAITAKVRRTDGREDDISVMAVAVRKGV